MGYLQNEYSNDYINFDVKKKRYKSEEEAIQASKNSLIPFGHYLDNKVILKKVEEIPKDFKEKAYNLFK